jgi:glutamate--cysteine ligase
MLLSGIHFNFSFPNDLIQKMFDNSSEENYRNFKDNLYLDVAGKLLDYSWLIVILTAASPVFDSSFVGESAGKTLHNGYGSVRCSKDGYWNTFVPYIDYTDLESYVDTIKDYVEQGLLKAESELYCPVRLKHQGVNSLDNLINNGVNHLEFRLLDVNPLYEVGVNPIDIKFIHLVIIYLSAQNNLSLSREVQKQAYDNIKASAMFDITSFVPKAKVILSEMKNFFGEDIPKDYKESLDFQMNKLDDKNSRYTYKILQQYGNDFIGKGVITAAKNSELRG